MVSDSTSRLKLVSPAASEPLSLAEAKLFLRVEHSTDDALITRAITAARQAAEEHMRLVLLAQDYRYETGEIFSVIALPVGPAQSIDAITAIDAEGEETVLDEDSYRLTLDGYGVIFSSLPMAETLVIEFSAASASSAEDVPAMIKQGILHHVAALVEQRHGMVAMPVASIACYQPYRRVRL